LVGGGGVIIMVALYLESGPNPFNADCSKFQPLLG